MKRISEDIDSLRTLLRQVHRDGLISVALLYGSAAHGKTHAHSDIDLALYITKKGCSAANVLIDRIMMAAERNVGILRLDDEEESPFVVQEALQGIPLIDNDAKLVASITHRVLHETESIRHRRGHAA